MLLILKCHLRIYMQLFVAFKMLLLMFDAPHPRV